MDCKNFFTCPENIQFQIFSAMDIEDHIRMRENNASLRRLNDEYWRSEFKKACCKAEKQLNTSEAALLLAMKISTEVYVENEYESLFFDCLLPYLTGGPKALFSFTESKLEAFLNTFYFLVDKQIIEFNQSKLPRSLYALTFLHQLKCLPHTTMNVERNSLGLVAVIQIKNMWLGSVCELITRQKLDHLLIAMMKILTAVYMQRTTAYVEHSNSHHFIFGYEFTERSRSPRTRFEISIDASKDLIDSIHSWLTTPFESVCFPREYLKAGIGFIFKIQVKSYVKYGWPQIIYMDLENNNAERSASGFVDDGDHKS